MLAYKVGRFAPINGNGQLDNSYTKTHLIIRAVPQKWIFKTQVFRFSGKKLKTSKVQILGF